MFQTDIRAQFECTICHFVLCAECIASGSVGMGMDTSSSDHDIFVQIKDGDADMVQLLHDVILDLQQKDTHYRLKRSKIVRKDFAIEIQGYYRARDFDIVPYTIRPDEGECQWDAERGVWQPILHKKLTPKLQELSEDQPDAFLMTRLLKIWNESLPTLRKSDTNDKVPLISLHIPLMVLAARDHGVLDVCQNPQGFFLKSLKFLQENWWRSDLACQTLEGIEADAHLQRMCKKYRDAAMHEELSQLLDDHVKILEFLCQQQGNDKRTADLIVSQLRFMFGGELLTPRPAYKAPLVAN